MEIAPDDERLSGVAVGASPLLVAELAAVPLSVAEADGLGSDVTGSEVTGSEVTGSDSAERLERADGEPSRAASCPSPPQPARTVAASSAPETA